MQDFVHAARVLGRDARNDDAVRCPKLIAPAQRARTGRGAIVAGGGEGKQERTEQQLTHWSPRAELYTKASAFSGPAQPGVISRLSSSVPLAPNAATLKGWSDP